jgi:polyhydroxyalkanoate synthase
MPPHEHASREAGAVEHDAPEQAAHHTLAANPLVGVRALDPLDSARALLGQMATHPGLAAPQYLSFLGELGRIATGSSEPAPDAKDKRFADAAWIESAAYRRLAQCYLAWGGSLNRFVDQAKMDKRDTERVRFIVSLFIDAMSPTNSLAGNPAALKKLVDTGGASLVHGLENFVTDLARNGGLVTIEDGYLFLVTSAKRSAELVSDLLSQKPSAPVGRYDPLPHRAAKGRTA